MSLLWVDYVIVGILLVSGLLGLLRGFVREFLSLIAWVLAIWAAVRFGEPLAVYLQPYIDAQPLRKAASFCLVLFVVLVVSALIASLTTRMLSSAGLSGTDRLVGLVFGVFRGAILVSVLVILAGLTPAPRSVWWKQSKLIPPFTELALWIRGQLPAGWLAALNYH